ncbi:hypothetical protein OG439_31950 [Amycolatopsis sp. NBC_01307]|uniref:hypothetical protein n=1 Tax=Amycolatopsis sp. NBC_01307 TaxID=2903561 RepID=UPI002E0D7B27|nr:hypothetical protein OG439_31950 [Amycolatopsis sp. NBC_01307]
MTTVMGIVIGLISSPASETFWLWPSGSASVYVASLVAPAVDLTVLGLLVAPGNSHCKARRTKSYSQSRNCYSPPVL